MRIDRARIIQPAGEQRSLRPARRRPARSFAARLARAFLVTVTLLLLLAWTLPPVVLVYWTLHPPRIPVRTPLRALPFPATPVAIPTRDGLVLRGWLGIADAAAPVILFGHGYPATREQMIPYAAVLYQSGYNVLLFDWRGWGESDGATTTFGEHESDDLSDLMTALQRRPDLRGPRFGGLGVSLGAGLMLLGAAHDHRLAAVVCDSTYTVITPMFTQWESVGLRIWPGRLVFAPLAAPAANAWLDGRLGDLDPLAHAGGVSPSALLLVHAQHDHNGLTPLSGAQQIYAAAREPKALWVAPRGDHASVLAADPALYSRTVVRFFDTYLRGR